MKTKSLIVFIIAIAAISCKTQQSSQPTGSSVTMLKDILLDKIKGGWAGQTIGVSYGGPTEFRYKGTMIQNYYKMPWDLARIKWWYDNAPGLYDDVYMDLTFVDVFERCGLDAPADSFANAFAHAGYMLWHANQSARYNILNGIMPPQSGNWLNNPHADCIDYQIEADFSGLMSPGMPNTASEISDKIGHIMNYGDGWYGGVYVGAMYSLAFVSNNREYIVEEALKAIPNSSTFYKCISDVIKVHKQNPNDWKQAWFEVEKNYTEDHGCPDGIYDAFNIDATVNAAYVVIGLLYGDGDFKKTADIATRCGQDSDCNPATAGGILGTILGYTNIPKEWMAPLKPVEDMDFKYTTISLNKVYKLGFKHALQNIERNGGKVNDTTVTIAVQTVKPVKFEKSFANLAVTDKKWIDWRSEKNSNIFNTDFEGVGIVLTGFAEGSKTLNDYVINAEISIDGAAAEKIKMPVNFTTRRNEVYWNYKLSTGKHKVEVKLTNPKEGISLHIQSLITYKNI